MVGEGASSLPFEPRRLRPRLGGLVWFALGLQDLGESSPLDATRSQLAQLANLREEPRR